jgi:hypothetical protein
VGVVRPLAGAAVVVAAGACGVFGAPDWTDPAQAPPCARPDADVVQLGRPLRYAAPLAATFHTGGSTLYLTANGFAPPGIIDLRLPNATLASIGPAATPPLYDQRRAEVSPVAAEVLVPQGGYGRVDLPAGDYWLVISEGADIELWSCAAGTLTGGPAPSPTRPPLAPPQPAPATTP